MSADEDDRDAPSYKVGHKNPPLHTRFKPGTSGNPKGRPKGRRNLKHDLEEELSERLTLRDGDRKLRVSKQRALVKSTIARAIKGDVRAQIQAYNLVIRAFGVDDEVRTAGDIGQADADILASYLDRMTKGNSR